MNGYTLEIRDKRFKKPSRGILPYSTLEACLDEILSLYDKFGFTVLTLDTLKTLTTFSVKTGATKWDYITQDVRVRIIKEAR